MTKSIIDVIGRSEAFKLMEDAVVKAANDNERLGLPKAVKVNGAVHRQHADGTLEQVEAVKASTVKLAQPKKSLSRAA